MYALPTTLLTTLLLTITTTLACTKCPHPGTFTGKLAPYTNVQYAYCTLEDTPPNSIYASVSADFYNPPDQAPCTAPINVTNPVTRKTIRAIVVGQCKTCTGNGLFLTEEGFKALGTDGRRQTTPSTVEWTFAGR